MLYIKGLREKLYEKYWVHRQKWMQSEKTNNHALTYDAYTKGYEDAQEEVYKILEEIPEAKHLLIRVEPRKRK